MQIIPSPPHFHCKSLKQCSQLTPLHHELGGRFTPKALPGRVARRGGDVGNQVHGIIFLIFKNFCVIFLQNHLKCL